MPLTLAFVTNDALVLETVAAKRAALLPNEVRKDGYAYLGGLEVRVSAFDTGRSRNIDQLLDAVSWGDASGVILLTDDSWPNLVNFLGDQFSVHRFTPPAYDAVTANQLTATISKCLRAYRWLSLRFDDAKYQQMFRLPLRNFDAPEIAALRWQCRDMLGRDYAKGIETEIGKLRKRQAPKKAADYKDVYYVDDDGKHFQLGHELHSRADTAIPPHNTLCVIANCLRFGLRFDGTTHFNVSRDNDASMIGAYPNCHSVKQPNARRSHVNMFSSDFFT